MIYSPQRRLVVFTPPKCGTNTLHEVLPRHGFRIVMGPQFDGAVGEHTLSLEYDVWRDLASHRFAVAARHPYARTASLYGHYCHYWPPPHAPFPEFVASHVIAPKFAFFNATIASLLHLHEYPVDGRTPVRFTEVIRVESLADDLRRLGVAVDEPLPRVHALPNAGRALYTGRAQELVDLWARHDFDRFGYARDLDAAFA